MVEHSLSPLAGKRVVITRAEAQSATLAQTLRAKGAEIVSLPLIRIAPPDDFAPLDSALRELAKFDWVIFTSQNAVAATSNRLAVLGISGNEQPASLRIAAVGPATAGAAQSAGFNVTFTGKGSTAMEFVCELANELSGKRIFLPRSDRAAAALLLHLKELGAQVSDRVAYRTISLGSVTAGKREVVSRADAILFFSPSAVKAFLDLIKSGVLSSLGASAAVGAIGSVTHSALLQAHLRCDFQAQGPSVNAITAALAAHFDKAKASSVSGVNSR